MGCCCSKKNNDEPLLRKKGSIDYDAVTNNKIQYVNDDNNDPNLTYINDDNFSVNVKSRSQNTSLQNASFTSSQNTSLPNNINDMTSTDYEELKEWKPSILKTYKIELKSPTNFSNKELLSLLDFYDEYYKEKNIIENKNKSFLSLYNWFEKENKKGGQQEKLKRIRQFSIDNNIFNLPTEIAKYLSEYYIKTHDLTLNKTGRGLQMEERDKYYIKKIKDIICINQKFLQNVDFVEINGIKLYYKIYYPTNNYKNLYDQRIPLILISEYGQCKEEWLLLPKLLSKNRMVITFDMRGIGQTGISVSASLQNSYSIDLLSSDIAGLIEKLYPEKKLFILGNGILGGIIAQTLCIRFEHLINGSILCNTLAPTNYPYFTNLYLEKYNHNYISNSQLKNKITMLNKNNKNKKNKYIACVESVTLISPVDDEKGERDIDIPFFYNDYDAKTKTKTKTNKCNIYNYIMECTCTLKNNNKQCPFVFNTINGNFPSSLLNRPTNGILAQQNGFIKLLSTKTNVISSRINEIKQSTLILFGKKDIIVPYQSSQYLSSKLIDVDIKEMRVLNNAGHLWWITHSKQSVEIINEFLFKIERHLLTRYDITIQNIHNINQHVQLLNEYTIIITSKSFITSENHEYKQKYEISSHDIQNINNSNWKFLCMLTDLGREELIIKIKSKNKKESDAFIGIGTCILTESYNAQLIIDITNIHNNDETLMQFSIKHGWNKYEFQQRLNEQDNAPDMITPGGAGDTNDGYNQQLARLDSADLDGLDI